MNLLKSEDLGLDFRQDPSTMEIASKRRREGLGGSH